MPNAKPSCKAHVFCGLFLWNWRQGESYVGVRLGVAEYARVPRLEVWHLADGHTDTLVEHQVCAYQALGFGPMTEHQRRYVMRCTESAGTLASVDGDVAKNGHFDRSRAK